MEGQAIGGVGRSRLHQGTWGVISPAKGWRCEVAFTTPAPPVRDSRPIRSAATPQFTTEEARAAGAKGGAAHHVSRGRINKKAEQ